MREVNTMYRQNSINQSINQSIKAILILIQRRMSSFESEAPWGKDRGRRRMLTFSIKHLSKSWSHLKVANVRLSKGTAEYKGGRVT